MKYFGLSLVFAALAQLSTALVVPGSQILSARGNAGNRLKSGNNNQNNDNNSTSRTTDQTGDPQTSLSLDPSVIQNINGTGSEAGQSDSLVSKNNFINYCVGKNITNGLQARGGSCNPTPMGDIPSVDNMPSCKFLYPTFNANIQANTAFTVLLNIRGMGTGDFTNPDTTYFAAPQQLNKEGQIKGHNHITIEAIDSINSTKPLDPSTFIYFKGLNAAAVDGQLSANVSNGLPAGVYRISTITTGANHQCASVPVAQRGSTEDAVIFTVGGNTNTTTTANDGQSPTNNTTSGNNDTQNPVGGKKGGRNGRRYERRFFTWD